MLFLPSVAVSALAADGTGDVRERLAKKFAGSYRFNYLFVEGCALYLDESSHLQLLELGKNPIDAQGKKLTARKEKISAGLFVSCTGRTRVRRRRTQFSSYFHPKPARNVQTKPAIRPRALVKKFGFEGIIAKSKDFCMNQANEPAPGLSIRLTGHKSLLSADTFRIISWILLTSGNIRTGNFLTWQGKGLCRICAVKLQPASEIRNHY
jgi:hypothetical protein